MRWLFLLLLMMNIFYFVWSQQQLPSLAQSVSSFTLYDGEKDKIRLLGEVEGLKGLPAAGVRLADNERCLFLGGFEHQADAMALEQRLLSLDIMSKVHEREDEAGVDYWVYLAPLSSREAALRQLKELQLRAIDSYLITQGDLANGISLGIFSRHDSARSVQQRMRSIGYAAELRELRRTSRTYWLQVPSRSGSVIGDDLLVRLAKDFSGLQQQQDTCENAVASPL